MSQAIVPPWVGTLPDSWRAERLKLNASVRNSNVDKKTYDDGIPVRLCNYTDVYYNEFITDDMQLMEATATLQERQRFQLQLDDVVITKDSESWDDIGIPACVAEELDNVVCGYHLTMIRPENNLDGRFLMRSLMASGIREQFHLGANGVTRFGIGLQDIKDTLVPVPPLETQRRIAAFLDRKTAAIDALITKKERLITLLQEKRQALITQAVTKGPQRRLKFALLGIEQGWSPQCDAMTLDEEQNGWGVVKVGCVNGGAFNEMEHKVLPADLEPHKEYQIRRGDFLVSRANTRELVGSACCVHDIKRRLLLCDKVFRLTLSCRKLHPIFLSWAMQTKRARDQIEMQATGASDSMQNISRDVLLNLVISMPPRSEQEALITQLMPKIDGIATSLAKLETSVAKLTEYRQALISAAVTGQLTVPEESP